MAKKTAKKGAKAKGKKGTKTTGEKKKRIDPYEGWPVKVMKLEITNLSKDDKSELKDISETMKRIINAIRRNWLLEHTLAGSPEKLQAYFQAHKEFYAIPEKERKERKLKKPKCPVVFCTPEMSSRIAKKVKTAYPTIYDRCHEITRQLEFKRLKNAPASKSAYPRWMRSLADDGEMPSSSQPQPIPTDKYNGEIIPPLNKDENYKLRISLGRIVRNGKRGVGIQYTIELLTKRRGISKYRGLLDRIILGELAYAGCNLIYKNGKWYALICYKTPPKTKAKVDPKKFAFLHAGRTRPWELRIDGYNHWLHRNLAGHVRRLRRQLFKNKRGFDESYTYASSSRKGHGRQRANDKRPKMTYRWFDFVNNANNQLVNDVVQKCIEAGYGTLVYYQPAERVSESRLLYRSGKDERRRDSTGWDWAQIGVKLQSKCNEVGIELVIKKVGERKTAKANQKKTPKPKTRRKQTTKSQAA